MYMVSDEQFEALMNTALDSLPKEHIDHLKNVALVYEDDPDDEQRLKVALQDDQTLFGLYEGIPLARRQGMQTALPDKITLFKNPLQMASYDIASLRENIRHTLWHEIAHYYGLDHEQIGKLE
jgi:predicted Zn-dependent protease with MMP-like domain